MFALRSHSANDTGNLLYTLFEYLIMVILWRNLGKKRTGGTIALIVALDTSLSWTTRSNGADGTLSMMGQWKDVYIDCGSTIKHNFLPHSLPHIHSLCCDHSEPVFYWPGEPDT